MSEDQIKELFELKFNHIDSRFDNMNERLTEISNSLRRMNDKLESHSSFIGSAERDMAYIGDKIVKIDESLDANWTHQRNCEREKPKEVEKNIIKQLNGKLKSSSGSVKFWVMGILNTIFAAIIGFLLTYIIKTQ